MYTAAVVGLISLMNSWCFFDIVAWASVVQ